MPTCRDPLSAASDAPTGTLGGGLLRRMRQERGFTLMEVVRRMRDAGRSMNSAHLQRIEVGTFVQPKQSTVDAVLTAGLGAPFRVREDVLAAYGYRLAWTLPTSQEVEQGIGLARHELASATWPASVHDFGQRLWAWNGYVPRLLGLPSDDPALARLVGRTTLDLVFDPGIGAMPILADLEALRPRFLRMFRAQTQAQADEPWFGELIERAHGLPGFTETWATLEGERGETLHSQPIDPIAFAVPGVAHPLTFRIVGDSLALDPRFQVAHWIPYGSETMAIVSRWAAEDGTR